LLKVDVLHKAYGKTVAVEDVSFDIRKGSCFGLLGPNGAGKTTTISIIAGILSADSGSVSWDGNPISLNAFDVKRKIGYVPQDLALYDDLTAAENLRFFGMLYGLTGETLTHRMDAVLTIAGLLDRQKQAVRTFSGGMKRRLNIAITLLHNPDFLILDEPTVGVDPQSRNLIFEALEALLKEGKTILYTTHYMEEVERLCDRVAIMDQGRIIANGTLPEVHKLVTSRCVVHVQLQDQLAASEKLPGQAGMSQGRPILTVEVTDLTKDLPIALAKIEALGGIVEDVYTERPSLEEVFLHLTGRTLRD
jgi:ABC-2 type transport system ATP-binding protein